MPDNTRTNNMKQFWKVNHSFTHLHSIKDLDRPLSNSAWRVFSYELKIPSVLILSLCQNGTKPSYFLAFSIFSFQNTVYTKLQRVKDKEGCMMDLYNGIIMFLALFIIPFLTIALLFLSVIKYWRGFNAIPSQCFLKISSINVLL